MYAGITASLRFAQVAKSISSAVTRQLLTFTIMILEDQFSSLLDMIKLGDGHRLKFSTVMSCLNTNINKLMFRFN